MRISYLIISVHFIVQRISNNAMFTKHCLVQRFKICWIKTAVIDINFTVAIIVYLYSNIWHHLIEYKLLYIQLCLSGDLSIVYITMMLTLFCPI